MAIAMSQAREICNRSSYFFSKETMRFWGSCVETGLYANRCFVTSEDNYNRTERLYTVRRFSPDYHHVKTVGEFQAYRTLVEAVEAAKRYKEDESEEYNNVKTLQAVSREV